MLRMTDVRDSDKCSLFNIFPSLLGKEKRVAKGVGRGAHHTLWGLGDGFFFRFPPPLRRVDYDNGWSVLDEAGICMNMMNGGTVSEARC